MQDTKFSPGFLGIIDSLNVLPYTIPYKFVSFGNGRTNPLNSELLHQITIGAFDAVIGDITITTNRSKIVDFTQPYIESGNAFSNCWSCCVDFRAAL
ncbi:hypothetical protein AAHE18_01G076700 [Arachis hypogaea]